MSDAAYVAGDLGLPVSLVEEQVGYQDQLDAIDFESLDRNFAAISSEIGDNFTITYASSGEPPAGVIAALSDAGLLRFAKMQKVPYSAEELLQAHLRIRATLDDSNIPADTSHNPLYGQVVVVTDKPVSSVQRGFAERSADGVPVLWTVGELSRPDAAGGYAMSQCTAGFVVERIGTGDRGVATAGHCDDHLSYAEAGGALTLKGEHFYGSGDFQWHNRPDVTWVNRVYDGSGTRAITGRKNKSGMDFGDQVTKYGKASGYTTGTVVELYWCPSYVPNCSNSFVLVNNNASGPMSIPGDSGGPVMWNNNAWGFVSGDRNNDLMIFAPQQYTQDVMNVRVYTG